MEVSLLYDERPVTVRVPDDSFVYASRFPQPTDTAEGLVLQATADPIGSRPLAQALQRRRPGRVVLVVSDITRPVPYASFLPQLLSDIVSHGVKRDDITVLVATGMHRPNTPDELRTMLSESVVRDYEVINHEAGREERLVQIPGRSWSGNPIKLNRIFVEAGFRLTTGLVEPHFMAGFSGGRKAVCPGLVSLETVRHFHGWKLLSDSRAANGILDGNPCHAEALSVAREARVDFTLNVVLDGRRRVVQAFAGELEAAHLVACDFVRACACPVAEQEADVVLASSGGFPLDATFYQCVKGMVACLPTVRSGGRILAMGGCRDGIGSQAYRETMATYSGRWRRFLVDIRKPGVFVKDQWQLQMQARVLEKTGPDNLCFFTSGLSSEQLATLSVTGRHVADDIQAATQQWVDARVREAERLAILPEGPYCTPLPATAP